MANVTITSGANSTPPDGTIIATDPVGAVNYQVIKLDLGAPGASSPVSGAVPVSGTVSVNPGTLALDATLTANGVLTGPVTETAPATDTASSGLNGRLQRIAQRLTSLIALLPASLGQKTSAGSLAVVVASDQSAIPVSGTVTATVNNAGTFAVQAAQSGTWTVQPGNTANTTAWKVDGSAVTQPVSGPLTDAQLRASAVPVSATALTDGSQRLESGGATGAAIPTRALQLGGSDGTLLRALSVDTSGRPNVNINGTVPISGAVTVASVATDAATTEPSTNLISGWDGLNVRSAFVQNLDGHNTLYTHDNLNRRILEQMLVEQRILNAQIARLLGPQGLAQRDMEPGQSLMN